jgi:hypothetical protein
MSTVVWDMMECSPVEAYRRFGENYYFLSQVEASADQVEYFSDCLKFACLVSTLKIEVKLSFCQLLFVCLLAYYSTLDVEKTSSSETSTRRHSPKCHCREYAKSYISD